MISVCIATYNGEEYLPQQLDSVLKNVSSNDEIIISDDGSTDSTKGIIEKYQRAHRNIRLIDGPHKGVIFNFENAIRQARGDYIFLCDQGDICENNKVERVISTFESTGCTVVIHDASIINGSGERIEDSFYSHRNSKAGFWKNLVFNSYLGCCMAFSRTLKKYLIPFPEDCGMHDWWIGLVSEVKGKSVFIDDKLIRYRRHDHNVSSMHHTGMLNMIKIRFLAFKDVIIRCLRVK